MGWFTRKKKERDLSQIVRVKMSGNEFTDIDNAFSLLGVTSDAEKEEILSTYTWHYLDDYDGEYVCAMQLVETSELEAAGPFDDTRDIYEIYYRKEYVRKRPKPVDDFDEEEDVVERNERNVSDIRANNQKIWEVAGFKASNALPWIKEVSLRPAEEIAGRLHAIKAMILWVLVPAEHLPDAVLNEFIDRNDLMAFLSEDEINIFQMNRDDEQLRNMIGWKFENAWPLAWYFGYVEPEISGTMMTSEQMGEIMQNHTCDLNENYKEWLLTVTPKSEEEVIIKEDLFYCLHNAVRSAQVGRPTVPQGFDPRLNGGVIHERRHSLTWMVSNGTSWDDTDLST
jgi:Domain of unknown function (DUF4272)